MRKLSCKIFNDYYIPELSKKEIEYGTANQTVKDWFGQWVSDLRVYQRAQERPLDLDRDRNENYYPAHPQLRSLTYILREYGLYRDEHKDFNDEMRARKIAKGKAVWQHRSVYKNNANAKK